MRITALALRALETWEAAARPLDTFIREVRSILNGGVRLDEQLAGELKRGIRYTGGTTLTVSTRVKTIPDAVLCMSAREALTGDQDIGSGMAVLWTYDSGAIVIEDIDGLTANRDYLVTLWIVEG
jgi:hypothetical protein